MLIPSVPGLSVLAAFCSEGMSLALAFYGSDGLFINPDRDSASRDAQTSPSIRGDYS